MFYMRDGIRLPCHHQTPVCMGKSYLNVGYSFWCVDNYIMDKSIHLIGCMHAY